LDRLASSQKRNRRIGFVDRRQRATTFRCPVEFGDRYPVDADRLVEPLGLLFGSLANSGIQYQQAAVGGRSGSDLFDLVDQVVFQRVSTRRIDDVDFGVAGGFEPLAGDLDGI